MQNPTGTRRSLIVLALSGTAFALHWVGWLEALVLWIAGVCGVISAVRLLRDSPTARRFLQTTFSWLERKVTGP